MPVKQGDRGQPQAYQRMDFWCWDINERARKVDMTQISCCFISQNNQVQTWSNNNNNNDDDDDDDDDDDNDHDNNI